MLFKMPLFLYLLWACLVVTTLQLQCDPLTQYLQNEKCCRMCSPGHSMTTFSTCEELQCKVCEDNEYQDENNHELKCKRQTYCDPHKNYEFPVHHSKTVKTICKCKQGFHCSGKDCISCVPHRVCEPGHGVLSLGNHENDTMCQKCSEGTFSNVSSLDSTCQQWTKCGDGYHVKLQGTAQSDNVCEKTSRTHIIVLSVVIGLTTLALVGFIYWLCRENIKEQVKHSFCYDSCRDEGKHEPTTETCIDMQPETLETKPMLAERESTQEEYSAQEGHGMTPEENLDEESQEFANYTENGNYVTQEKGKSDILSRQESQTHSSVQTNSE